MSAKVHVFNVIIDYWATSYTEFNNVYRLLVTNN